jgi:tetratricopeptide (TPR) repeat protein
MLGIRRRTGTDVSKASVADGNEPEKPGNEDSSVRGIVDRSRELAGQGQTTEALELLTKALEEHGNNSRLLAGIADVEEEDEQYAAAISHYAQAVAASPEDTYCLRSYADALHSTGLNRQAIKLILDLPPAIQQNPQLRASLGSTYRGMGWHALAVNAYGHPGTLGPYSRKWRRQSWWRSGGPLRIIRERAIKLDESARSLWNSFSSNLTVFDSLDFPEDFNSIFIRGRLDFYLQRWALLIEERSAFEAAIRRSAKALVYGATGVAFLATAYSAHKYNKGWFINALGEIALTIILLRIIVRVDRLTSDRPALLVTTVLSAIFAGAGALLLSKTYHTLTWTYSVAVSLMAAPLIFWAVASAVAPIRISSYLKITELQKDYAREAVLDRILDVLLGIAIVEKRNNLEDRKYWMNLLEYAARVLETRVPTSLHSPNKYTNSWLKERAKGAATAVRRMSQQIAVPTDTTWDRLICILRHEALALATGNLASLRWAPETQQEHRKTVWHTSFNVIRTLTVMAVPGIAILVLQPILDFDPHTFSWAKAVSIGWALLYLLVTVDPTLNDKINTARNLIGAAREVKPSRSSDN